MSETVRIRVGESVWWDGQSWDIEALTGPSARLRRGDEVRVVSINGLGKDDRTRGSHAGEHRRSPGEREVGVVDSSSAHAAGAGCRCNG